MTTSYKMQVNRRSVGRVYEVVLIIFGNPYLSEGESRAIADLIAETITQTGIHGHG